jgi:hypothetical protein
MKYCLIPVTLLLSGCWGTVPVVPEFPRLPSPTAMNIPCPELKPLKSDPTISDIAATLNLNYHTYYECAVKVESWNTWYREQKSLYENKIKP